MLLVAAIVSMLGAVELRWESAAGCPDAAAVDRDLDALLSERSREDAAEVTGRLEADQGAYVLHLEVARAGRREARELRANDCAVLTRAGVLVVAVTVDALATTAAVDALATPTPASEPEPAADPSRARPTTMPGRPAPSPSRTEQPALGVASAPRRSSARPPPGATLSARAGVSHGLTPAVAGGVDGELAWRRGSLRLAIAGFHWFSRTTELQPGVGVEAALSGGSLRGCHAFERARLEVPLCAGLDLAAMHGGGVGSQVRRRDASGLWIGVAAGVGLVAWPTRRFGLEARVEGMLGARRPAMFLVVDGEVREAFRVAPVGVRLLAGPVVRLW